VHATEPRLLGAGLLVEDIQGWPPNQLSIGTEGDRVFFIQPQAGGRGRLYLMYAAHQRRRFTGASAARDFLDAFVLACVPHCNGVASARPAGPYAAYPMNDTWIDCPVGDGLALVGDAAGYSDPHFGQGLSVAARDARNGERPAAGEQRVVAHRAEAVRGGARRPHAEAAVLDRYADHAARGVHARSARTPASR